MSLLSKNQIEENHHELEASISAAELDAACEKVFNRRKKNIEIPGFRKGKAPRKTVEKLYGEAVFYEDAINDLYPSTVENAVKESELDVVTVVPGEVVSISKEDGAVIKFVCVTKPQVEIEDYKGLKAPKNVKEVTDEDVNGEIERMRERNARTISVEDRPAEMGDEVVFDFDGYVDGEAFDGGKAEKYHLTLGSNQFIPGFEEQLAGHNVGEEFDVNVTFPEDYHAENLKGKAAVFKIKLWEINKKELPEVDDEFVKDVSEFDTLDELKNNIRERQAEANEKYAENEFETALLEALVEKLKGNIPEEMIDARVDEQINEFNYRLQSQGMSLDLYMKFSGMDMDGLRAAYKEQAEKTVKTRLALEKIVELEGITVDDADLDAEYEKLSAAYGMDVDQIKPMIPVEDLKKDIAAEKALNLIKEAAIVE